MHDIAARQSRPLRISMEPEPWSVRKAILLVSIFTGFLWALAILSPYWLLPR